MHPAVRQAIVDQASHHEQAGAELLGMRAPGPQMYRRRAMAGVRMEMVASSISRLWVSLRRR